MSSLVLSACAIDANAPTTADETESTSASLATGPVTAARVVTSSYGARRLELVGADGARVATYYPGFFTAQLIVPDVAGNSPEMIAARVQGTDVLAAAMNPRTGVVAVAVRGFIYAETSTDMIFLFDTRGARFAASPYATPTFLPFDGRDAFGKLATNGEPTRPFLDVASLEYDAAGRLVVRAADASGGAGVLRYAPDLTAVDCSWSGGEAARCPAR
ncbi:MAG: hypothetical protein R3B36_22495 [Polyangiaceae bacterium]